MGSPCPFSSVVYLAAQMNTPALQDGENIHPIGKSSRKGFAAAAGAGALIHVIHHV